MSIQFSAWIYPNKNLHGGNIFLEATLMKLYRHHHWFHCDQGKYHISILPVNSWCTIEVSVVQLGSNIEMITSPYKTSYYSTFDNISC